ncbi:hypothetical protein VTL71DRAFT_5426 [Oculimacula yallundae]|uniref:Fungal N-terminal domain-containing protein n=1 Tax=Oculimacula yallundae TaxID=86028 RepID=A0ABR4C285_9HELO
MAEVLGTVASGFAVVSLAIQIAETIQKLRKFHSLMQSAPTDILFAIEELETLSMVLEDVDRSMQEQVFLDPKVKLIVVRSWRLCKSATDGLGELVRILEKGIGMGKTRGKFKIAMKKGEMDDFRARIESAKATMLLANTIYYQATQNQRLDSFERDVLQLQRTHEHSREIILREVVHSRTLIMEAPRLGMRNEQTPLRDVVKTDVEEMVRDEDDSGAYSRTGASSYRMQQQRSGVKIKDGRNYFSGLLAFIMDADEYNTMTTISFGLPTWINARRFELRLMKCRQGWDHSFRSYRTLSYDAKIFRYCMAGNVAGLQHLFASGQASPFEIDPEGRTPLHYAALYAQPEACRLLLEMGAETNVQTLWSGNLRKDFYNAHSGQGLYMNLDDIPAEGPFRGWAAHSTPLHFLLNTGGLLTDKGRMIFNNRVCLTVCSTSNSSDFERTVRALAAFGADAMLVDQYSRTALHSYSGPTSTYGWLLKNSEWDLKVMPSKDIALLLMSQMRNTQGNSVEIIQCLMATKNDMNTVAHKYYLYVLSWEWGYSMFANLPSVTGLASLILDLVHAGADLHLLSRFGATPFLTLLKLCDDWPEAIWIAKRWLELLYRAGVDLQEYGRIESELHDNNETTWTLNWGVQGDCFQLVEIWIGKTPDDFYIEFEDLYATNGWAADFWEGIYEAAEEERTRAMPGGCCED